MHSYMYIFIINIKELQKRVKSELDLSDKDKDRLYCL